EGIRVLGDPDTVIVSVTMPMSEEKLAEILAGAPKEAKEPEVLTAKKAEGEAAAAGAKPEAKAEAKGKEEKKEGKK
ncbi:MAG TPA: hypothetical protein VFN94_06685, partial [Nitrospiria bacterium]|nr:hypothetical protein [Nitrospiria bacterium]